MYHAVCLGVGPRSLSKVAIIQLETAMPEGTMISIRGGTLEAFYAGSLFHPGLEPRSRVLLCDFPELRWT